MAVRWPQAMATGPQLPRAVQWQHPKQYSPVSGNGARSWVAVAAAALLVAALFGIVGLRAFHSQAAMSQQGLPATPAPTLTPEAVMTINPIVEPTAMPAMPVAGPLTVDPPRKTAPVPPPPPGPKYWCSVNDSHFPKIWNYDVARSPSNVKVLTYNLWWFKIGHPWSHARSMVIQHSGSPPYDFMGFQECENVEFILKTAGLLGQYYIYRGPHAMAQAVRNDRWAVLSQGAADVAEDSKLQYFGRRSAIWIRAQEKATGKTVFFMNHHGPTPVGSGGLCGGPATAYNLLKLIHDKAQRQDMVVFTGDFNADPFSSTMKILTQQLHQSFTFTPHGDVDQIFSNLGPSGVASAQVLPQGGSDHHPLQAVLKFSDSGPYSGPTGGQPMFVGVR